MHPIESVFQSVSLSDMLDFFAVDRPGIRVEDIEQSLPGGDTMVRAALEVFLEACGLQKGMAVALHKRIPIGAGLGGGSADAGAALICANTLWGGHLPTHKLQEISRRIGSDVGFFLVGGTCKVTGRGDVIQRIASLPRYTAVIAYPGFPVFSLEAYRWWDTEMPGLEMSIDEALDRLRKGEEARGATNAFERVLTSRYPEIAELLENLRSAGAFWCGVTGSGSAIYGLFQEDKRAWEAARNLRAKEVCELYVAGFEESAVVEESQ